MKRTLFAIAIAGLAMTSCKKVYTCTCTETENGVVISEYSWTAKLKKSDADKWCNGYTTTEIYGGVTYKDECKLK